MSNAPVRSVHSLRLIARFPVIELPPVSDVLENWQRVTFDKISLLLPTDMIQAHQVINTPSRGWQLETPSTKIFIGLTHGQAEELQTAAILRSHGVVALEILRGDQIEGILYRSSNGSAWFEWQFSDRSARGVILFEQSSSTVGNEDWVRHVCGSVRQANDATPRPVNSDKLLQ